MNSHSGWWPVALSRQLQRQPLACTLHGVPLVLFRDAEGAPSVLPDRCPHRFAPLSAGRVRDGQIQCPYHGWRFDPQGRCTHLPGQEQQRCSQPLLQPLHSCEAQGLVWASLAAEPPSTPPVAAAEQAQALDVFWISDRVRCTLQDAAENFLDGFHTHFVHAGWIRHDRQRQRIRAWVHQLEDGVEAQYSEEGTQSGLISRLFEGERGISMGRFRLPGLAEIEYRDRQGRLNLLVSAWLSPAAEGELRLFARIATARGRTPGWLKRGVLQPLFKVILKQDRQILEKLSANQQRFVQVPLRWQRPTPLDSSLDLLGPWIRQLLEQGELQGFQERHEEFLL
ncbi:Rieske 2Fe-2S domain-containing protein [Pseudomonas sp. Fl5BN2]|uniref:Rieske 2Fe-2S domain-containing protein n=1 Tax=Pseudomonas sp. Fl5BN2 TaxID=2697652 RepID=UPI001376811A|nr:Rieske 2Fe-2S domain-containing protein [Pseudomonas sp. Fl5BN2]